MKYSVALSGSYNGRSVEDLFNNLPMEGILHMSLIGREVALQVKSEKLDDVKRSLSKNGISNLKVLEWKKAGITVSDPGCGIDNNKTLRVSLIPSVKGEGIKQLSLLSDFEIDEKAAEEISEKVEEILENAGITDALYTVHIVEETTQEEYIIAASVATLNAIFDSGGIVDLD
ncbi:MAG: hypothetical protein JW778_01295 [Candidatus Altiarchaeota archaeon]|nr:hypothetical protein [Candidatus Altiarchaeota archaeon]